MSESLGIDNLQKKAEIEKGDKSDGTSNLGIYNLPDKVAGITSKLQNSPHIRSNRALEKRLRYLDRRCKVILQGIGKHNSEYEARFGRDAVLEAEQKLKQLSIQIQEVGGQRAADARDKRIQKLRDMGYGG